MADRIEGIAVRRFDTNKITPDDIRELAHLLNHEGVMVYPTETFYGLGGNGLKETVIDRIYRIKNRQYQNPLPLILKDLDMLDRLAQKIPKAALKLAEIFWPGPLTIVLQAREVIPKLLTAGTGKVAVRISSHPFIQRLLQAIDFPIISTSANISGMAAGRNLKQISETILSQVDAALDGGILAESPASTIIEFIDSLHFKVIRSGPLSEKELITALNPDFAVNTAKAL